jgi:hypothetical protein
VCTTHDAATRRPYNWRGGRPGKSKVRLRLQGRNLASHHIGKAQQRR